MCLVIKKKKHNIIGVKFSSRDEEVFIYNKDKSIYLFIFLL
jgi:hypothetical protein